MYLMTPAFYLHVLADATCLADVEGCRPTDAKDARKGNIERRATRQDGSCYDLVTHYLDVLCFSLGEFVVTSVEWSVNIAGRYTCTVVSARHNSAR